MIITTSGRPGENAFTNVETAKRYFPEAMYVERKKRSLKALQKQYQVNVLVAGDTRFELYVPEADEPFFYHPNSAAFRIKRLIKGGEDPLITAADLSPDDLFLDCTAGMASDALVASWYCSKVTAIERSKDVAFITGEGLKTFVHKTDEITSAMRQIELIHADAYQYLASCPSNQYDVIYFDPMFTETIHSEGISSLKKLAEYQNESLYMAVKEAKRVARKKVILKDHFRSSRFEELGFKQMIRPSTKQHYGIIPLKKPV
ncbi:class I SAM-dependent methyltransferase [Jeotgalibacillus haloalkalitolerans]|uniref:Class I SAM-dependent methyltransferase n=1 Tax=Jeotgalibacillus haloalkalitolerans TaxID=3104292 RepID=A0ABU5KL08_9BACL|nr:class I SAM-dependent methyltransferase [Jeotgalibacillus sp. HH7-29]MDZ5711950.1 class I SAM-dependent methyltransferase [Jeotgalibacillus sp. HH7-29]